MPCNAGKIYWRQNESNARQSILEPAA